MAEYVRKVVIWSGGPDSTVVLHAAALEASPKKPVIALGVTGHPQLDTSEQVAESRARKAYLKLAKKRGLHIDYKTVEIRGSAAMVVKPESVDAGAQAPMWLCFLAPYFGENDLVSFGYIASDSFWHGRHQFEMAMKAVAKLMGVTVTYHYPLEWWKKSEVVDYLSRNKIPKTCYWTCMYPRGRRRCGKCKKCLEWAAGVAQWKAKAD